MVFLLYEFFEIIMEYKILFWGREKDYCKFLWKIYLVYVVCRLKGVYVISYRVYMYGMLNL